MRQLDLIPRRCFQRYPAARRILYNMATGPRPKDSTAAEPLLAPAWVNPDLDRLMVVHKDVVTSTTDDNSSDSDSSTSTSTSSKSYYKSWAESLVDLPAGAIFARINGVTPTSKRDYDTVQSSTSSHFIWNSDLYYCNHSCSPTLECDTSTWEVRVSRDRPLRKGDVLSVFYPSTEWIMAREFTCWCGAGEKRCCGTIRGARDMDDADLRRYWLNRHIYELRKQGGGEVVEERENSDNVRRRI